jgi:very-short-patch-repair endonuclease
MTSDVTLRARSLRKSASPPERLLWCFLRLLRQEGHHFRRQAPLRGYYLDFVCFSRRLVIEVDGRQHGEDLQAEHDAVRDGVLAGEGFRVLRFQAVEVMQNLEGVAVAVREALAAPGVRPPPRPSPQGGGGSWVLRTR